MSKIVICATGHSGNFYPFFLLAKRLMRSGHSVCFATGNSNYKERIEGSGIQYRYLRDNELKPDTKRDAEKVRKVAHPDKSIRLLLEERIFPTIRMNYNDLISVTEGADLMISGVLPFAAALVHEKTNLPWVSIGLQPSIYMSDYQFLSLFKPSIPLPSLLKPHLNRVSKALFRNISDRWSTEWYRLREEIGLKDRANPFLDRCHSPDLQLAAYSPIFSGRYPDWPMNRVHVGFIQPDPTQERLSNALQEFLSQGEPPIVFTLGGSASIYCGEGFFTTCIEFLKINPIRAAFVCSELPEETRNKFKDAVRDMPNVIVTGLEPYSVLFPKADIIVHHGGIGTLGEGLRSGTPMVIASFGADQPHNASEAEKLGCSLWTHGKSLGKRKLAILIKKASQEKYRRRARIISKQLESEFGLENAALQIEKFLGTLNESRS